MGRPDARRMSDSRAFVVLFGAALLVASLFAPWFALDFSGATRDAITQQAGQLPGGLGAFASGLLSMLPERIVVDGWQAFERTDVVLLGCGLAAGFAALLGRFDVATLAGGAAAATIVLAMVDQPGPGGELIKLQWGSWLALAAAATIVAGGRLGARGESAPTAAPATAAAAPTATVWPPVDPAR
jgi:hypothetical protein